MDDLRQHLLNAMEDLDDDNVAADVKLLLEQNIPNTEVEEILMHGMRNVGTRFESGIYYLADLIVAGMIFSDALDLLPKQEKKSPSHPPVGKILLGVMQDDIHSIGKDMVKKTLEIEGFEVFDLGTDVSVDTFIQGIIQNDPDIVLLSGVMCSSLIQMQKAIQMIAEQKFNKKIFIVVGGSCTNEQASKLIGADAYSKTPPELVNVCKKIMEQLRKDESKN